MVVIEEAIDGAAVGGELVPKETRGSEELAGALANWIFVGRRLAVDGRMLGADGALEGDERGVGEIDDEELGSGEEVICLASLDDAFLGSRPSRI